MRACDKRIQQTVSVVHGRKPEREPGQSSRCASPCSIEGSALSGGHETVSWSWCELRHETTARLSNFDCRLTKYCPVVRGLSFGDLD